MPAEPTPQIDLPVEAVVCRVHAEPFRLTWPAGYPLFVVKAFEHAAGHEELVQATGGDGRRLNGAIAEYGPLCRLLTPEQRREAYTFATRSETWGERAVCASCGKWKLGSRGIYRNGPFGEIERHVCIDCTSTQRCQT